MYVNFVFCLGVVEIVGICFEWLSVLLSGFGIVL